MWVVMSACVQDWDMCIHVSCLSVFTWFEAYVCIGIHVNQSHVSSSFIGFPRGETRCNLFTNKVVTVPNWVKGITQNFEKCNTRAIGKAMIDESIELCR